MFSQPATSSAFDYDNTQSSQSMFKTPSRPRHITAATSSTPYVLARQEDFPSSSQHGFQTSARLYPPANSLAVSSFSKHAMHSSNAQELYAEASQGIEGAYMHPHRPSLTSCCTSPVPEDLQRRATQLTPFSNHQQPPSRSLTYLTTPVPTQTPSFSSTNYRQQHASTLIHTHLTPPPSSQDLPYAVSNPPTQSQPQSQARGVRVRSQNDSNSLRLQAAPEPQGVVVPDKIMCSVEIQTDPLPAGQIRTPQGDDTSPMIASLLENPKLADLSLDELEMLIGNIIREDGFVQFVRVFLCMIRSCSNTGRGAHVG